MKKKAAESPRIRICSKDGRSSRSSSSSSRRTMIPTISSLFRVSNMLRVSSSMICLRRTVRTVRILTVYREAAIIISRISRRAVMFLRRGITQIRDMVTTLHISSSPRAWRWLPLYWE